jgi:hypothetical protein
MKIVSASLVIISVLSICSCAPLETLATHDFASGYYKLKTRDNGEVRKVYADISGDSINVYDVVHTDGRRAPATGQERIITVSDAGSGNSLIRTSVDADLSTILTKLRPSQGSVPLQLNANLNALVYIGYRKDYFMIKSSKDPLKKSHSFIRHAGFDAGLFAGLGITQVTPTNTDFKTLKEYDGVVFQKGVAVFFTIERISLGVSLGFDNLLDENSKIWLYNQKPYIGLVLGIANF